MTGRETTRRAAAPRNGPGGRSARVVVALTLVVVAVAATFLGTDAGLPDGEASGAGSGPTASIEQVIVPTDPIVVGEPLTVELRGRGPGEVRLDVVDAFAVSSFDVALTDGVARFEVPAALLTANGRVHVEATGIDGSASASVELLPASEAVDADLHLAEATVAADGAESSMAIAIVVDEFGNPLADSTVVDFHVVDPSSAAPIVASRPIGSGVAAILLGAGTRTGPVDVFVSDGGLVASERRTLALVAGPAEPVDVVLPPAPAQGWRADGRTVVEVATGPVTDRNGNTLPDGHQVRLVVEGPDGSGRLGAKTIDGIARFDVVLPATPGRVEFAVSVDGVTGPTSVIDVGLAVSSLPITARAVGDLVEVTVGPVLDADGALAEDGTVALVTSGTETRSVELRDGIGEIELGVAPTGSSRVEVRVLGFVASTEVVR